jgi:fluoride exporter
MTEWILVMVGAALGAPSRWLTDGFTQARHDSVFPWGTFTVNIAGSLLLGFLLGASLEGDDFTRLMALAGTGFCGAFTTFSTFAYESVVLAEEGSSLVAVLNLVGSVLAGLAAAFAGWAVAAAVL